MVKSQRVILDLGVSHSFYDLPCQQREDNYLARVHHEQGRTVGRLVFALNDRVRNQEVRDLLIQLDVHLVVGLPLVLLVDVVADYTHRFRVRFYRVLSHSEDVQVRVPEQSTNGSGVALPLLEELLLHTGHLLPLVLDYLEASLVSLSAWFLKQIVGNSLLLVKNLLVQPGSLFKKAFVQVLGVFHSLHICRILLTRQVEG